ncbi:MAG: MotA/TolQ/ExbB proton channel family protein [Desulfobacteraceae bacterium]|nr:MotA/TolQ/ExbB proton channel family protein [Desulfobacteraceae bacterium]
MNSDKFNVIAMVADASPMVQFVIFLLLAFSVATWAIILIKYVQVRRAYNESAFFIEYFWKTRDFSNSFAKAKELRYSPVARIFRIAYMELKKLNRLASTASQSAEHGDDTAVGKKTMGVETVRRALNRSVTMESLRLIQMVPFLATTGNISPFIGLFGTVWGIMHSFHGIAYKQGATSLAAVAPGISEALVATAAGLAVAIPAVIGYNYFTQKIRILESEMESFSSDFINIVESDYMAYREAAK